MKILVTAGPTREYLDAVRFISNASSGRMGIYMAEAAAERGHQVSLVLGPTSVRPGTGIEDVRDVTNAEEMHNAVFERFHRCDVLIMAAAVSDVRPEKTHRKKVKKSELDDRITLEPTPDILAEAGRRKQHQTLVGFAVESERLEQHGRSKFRQKNLDLLVLNRPSAMGSRRNQVHLMDESDSLERLPELEKSELADRLIDRVLNIVEATPDQHS